VARLEPEVAVRRELALVDEDGTAGRRKVALVQHELDDVARARGGDQALDVVEERDRLRGGEAEDADLGEVGFEEVLVYIQCFVDFGASYSKYLVGAIGEQCRGEASRIVWMTCGDLPI